MQGFDRVWQDTLGQMQGSDFVAWSECLFMQDSDDDIAYFQETLDRFKVLDPIPMSKVAHMKKALQNLYYPSHKRFWNTQKRYPGHIFSHTILTNFPWVEFQVTACQVKDIDTAVWKWNHDLFHVSVWNSQKLKALFRQIRLPTTFLSSSGMDGKTLIDIWINYGKNGFTTQFPKGFGMNNYQYEKFNEAMKILHAKKGTFEKEQWRCIVKFSLHSTKDSAASAPTAGNRFFGERASRQCVCASAPRPVLTTSLPSRYCPPVEAAAGW